jgi:CRISPR/Cas system CSM-associated protein Csm3 (group 7 of RAMP superfamily)
MKIKYEADVTDCEYPCKFFVRDIFCSPSVPRRVCEIDQVVEELFPTKLPCEIRPCPLKVEAPTPSKEYSFETGM